MSEVGRPSELTDVLLLNIRELVLQGKNLKEIAEECGIAYKTMEGWKTRNYEGFSDKLLSYKQEWRLLKAEENIDSALTIDPVKPLIDSKGNPVRNTKGEVVMEVDPKLMQIKMNNSQFVAETLGKDIYSKRQEMTGKGGTPLVPTDEAKEVVNRLKAAAGLPVVEKPVTNQPVQHETKPDANNGAQPAHQQQPVAGNQNVV